MNESARSPSRSDFARAAETITAWRKPLLLTHSRADGDALGCMVAMHSVLKAGGATPRVLLFDPVSPRYEWLLNGVPVEVSATPTDASLNEADGVLILDTCAYSQMEPAADWLRRASVPRIVVDHHVTRDSLADTYLIDETASAACLVIFDWAQVAGWTLDQQASLALYAGIATDTGWFRFSNTDARTLEAVAHLVAGGVSPAAIFEKVYQTESAARFRLLGAVLANVELHDDNRLAVLTITSDLFDRTGADHSDTDDIINYPLQIGRVNASVLLVENSENVVRASFRSKPPDGVRPDLDVSAVAAAFGGGGHRRAAGARVRGTLEEVKRRIVEQMT